MARTPTSPSRRTDALRNRQRLIDAATKVFTEQGVDAPLDAIARAAGVGNATMYRHFPTREAILEVVLQDLHDELGRQAEELLHVDPPGETFIRWLAGFLDYTQSLLGLPEPLASAIRDESSALYASCERMRVAATKLLTRAQEAGELRRDLTADDLFAHALGIAWVAQRADDKHAQAARLFAVLANGIRELPA